MKNFKKFFFQLLCVFALSACSNTNNPPVNNTEETSVDDTHLSQALEPAAIPSAENNAEIIEDPSAILLRQLEENPDGAHDIFLGAELYWNNKHYQEAIVWYKARIAHKDRDKKENWLSLYRIAQCYEALNEWSPALDYYLQAHQEIPAIADPIERIATYYRLQRKNNLAYAFAKYGATIPYPANYADLTSKHIYDYRFDEELLIAAYYINHKQEGLIAGDRLINSPDVPEDVKNKNKKNFLFYIQNLLRVRLQPISITLPLIREGLDLHYNPQNSSILKIEDGYLLICRTVNFTQTGGCSKWYMIDPDAKKLKFDNKSFLVKCDKDFHILWQKEILDHIPLTTTSDRVNGLEDFRIFSYNDKTYATTTLFADVCKIALIQFDDQNTENTTPLKSIVVLKGPIPNRHEKNWLPFIKDGEIHTIYSYDPLTIYKINQETGETETVLSEKPPLDFSHFRGSASPIPFDDGHLIIVHQVICKDGSYYYIHRFLYLDKNYHIKKMSLPFTYKHLGVEFCSGMTVDHADKNLVMTISSEESESYFAFVPLDTVRTLLQPIPTH